MHRLLHPAGDHRRGHCLAATASHARKLLQIVIWQSYSLSNLQIWESCAAVTLRMAGSRIPPAFPPKLQNRFCDCGGNTSASYCDLPSLFQPFQNLFESVFVRLGRGPLYISSHCCVLSLHFLTKTWVKILCELDWSELNYR